MQGAARRQWLAPAKGSNAAVALSRLSLWALPAAGPAALQSLEVAR